MSFWGSRPPKPQKWQKSAKNGIFDKFAKFAKNPILGVRGPQNLPPACALLINIFFATFRDFYLYFRTYAFLAPGPKLQIFAKFCKKVHFLGPGAWTQKTRQKCYFFNFLKNGTFLTFLTLFKTFWRVLQGVNKFL